MLRAGKPYREVGALPFSRSTLRRHARQLATRAARRDDPTHAITAMLRDINYFAEPAGRGDR